MTRWRWSFLGFVGLAGTGIAVGFAISNHTEIASVAISIPILLIAALTLRYTVPQRARLEVDRLHEAGLTDLIFYVYPQSNLEGEKQVPRDYLLQLHVAVSNLGGRKAVLSRISLDGFLTSSGETIHLPGATKSIGGVKWVQRSGWINNQHYFENLNDPGPYILEPDDAIVLRFRTRRGVDWSTNWNLDSLREFCEPLREPIVSAFGEFAWRRGGEVVNEKFSVPVKVAQQSEYVQLIEQLTQGFTAMPDLPEQKLNIE